MNFSFEKETLPKKGLFLVSNPLLEEDYFTRSVILLVDFGEEGAFGLVVNNYITQSLQELGESLPKHSLPVSLGGPMEQSSLFILHREDPPLSDSKHIANDLFFSGNFKELSAKYQNEKDDYSVRYFLGYSGWDKGQLEREIEENAWIVCDNVPYDDLFEPKIDDFWRHVMQLQGGKFKVMSQFPKDPSLN
jgi:putative transcriptional regulator